MARLQADAITNFRRDGYLFPLAGIGADRAHRARAALEDYEKRLGGTLTTLGPPCRYKLHVRLPWVRDIAADASVLDAVEDLIGPDIMVFTSTMFVKEPRADAVTLWHQDATYFGLRPHEHVTAWVALSQASELAGCMTFLSENGAPHLFHHRPNMDPKSINGGGQTIVESFDKTASVRAALSAGDFSLHHTLCIHSSPPNDTDDRRIGLGISYIPTRVKHIGTIRQRAMLVRGTDAYGHFEPEPDPGADSSANGAQHELSLARHNEGYAEQIRWHDEGRVRS